MDKKNKKINQETYWQQGYLTIRRKNWYRLMFTVCCVTIVILLSLLILNPFSHQTVRKQPQNSMQQRTQTNSKYRFRLLPFEMNNSLSADAVLPRSLMVLAIDNRQKDIHGNKQQVRLSSIADFAQSWFSLDELVNSKISSSHAMQKLHQAMLVSTTAVQALVAMHQSKPRAINPQAILYHCTMNLPVYPDFVAANETVIGKNKNISHTSNSLDHQKLPDQWTQRRSSTKAITSNKKQANDLSHALTLQVASLHDPIQAQLIKAKLNNKGFPSRVEEFKLGGRMFYRVRVGTYNSLRYAHEVANKLKAAGYYSNISEQ